MLLLSSIIVFTGTFASWKLQPLTKEFFMWFTLLSTGVYGFFISIDLFTMFMFYEVALIPMYLLIGYWGSGRKEYAAMKLTLMLMGGSALIILGLVGIYFFNGASTMNILEIAHNNHIPDAVQNVLFPFVFYYGLHAAVHASKKAFIVTRFADMFFLIGILIFGYYTGSFNFSFTGTEVHIAEGMTAFTTCDASRAAAAGGFILPTALVLMFIGGAGKSAMFPLHIWLPDAMEGPTPVSALIHAATMVVAGVVQIARLFPIWIEYAPQAMEIVVYVGAFTAFYAAAVACAQSDIKRVLAFSTISQIAFMMVALGVCLPGHHGAVLDNHAQLGYMASLFHLFTHAMFKACLFLGAGCIIHAVHSNEMSAMGGLKKYMPITHATFLISCLAIAGIPFFSGFSSKDEIITACFEHSQFIGWWMTGVAAMTAFYMFRLYYGIFWGTENKELHAHHTPHEAPLPIDNIERKPEGKRREKRDQKISFAEIIMFEKDFVKTKTSKLIAQQGSNLIGNEISVSPSTSL
jgi:NADH:ubiquinone oxidoreductase subunit 5 (subunit L)/multisubunit Na+/H+ antiporter MnhA subunit